MELLASALVGGLQVGEHEEDVLHVRLSHRVEEVRKRRHGHLGEVRVADLDGARVLEVGRKLIKEDEHLFALEEIHPRALSGSLERGIEILEEFLSPHLLGERPPDAELRVRFAPRERDHLDGAGGGVFLAEYLFAERGITREQGKREHVVGLAAAHRLGEFDDTGFGLPLESLECDVEQQGHPPRAKVLREETLLVDRSVEEVRDANFIQVHDHGQYTQFARMAASGQGCKGAVASTLSHSWRWR